MRLCVFCGSSPGNKPEYLAAAQQLGTALAKAGIGLVYGGAQVGLMGAVADAALAAGGDVIGVIPRHLVERELAHEGLTTLHEVGSMHERKAMMADLSDGFIALPGGVGTFEELFEVWTWGQLGHHQKPCALFNAASYYDQLIAFLDHALTEGFMRQPYRDMLIVDNQVDSLLDRVRRYSPPAVSKWVKAQER
ncbi:TIGR00730 family Rossman fold protein [Halopseudomonas aestusnigri]|uniref:LOG family protein n=1 Tax=Halopseudomonas aestusnigri TaxID=857252 RepID=UPI0028C1B088|nr:TIGR00730 family Rossman fold protein [Halopseudomonas aestusnigri]